MIPPENEAGKGRQESPLPKIPPEIESECLRKFSDSPREFRDQVLKEMSQKNQILLGYLTKYTSEIRLFFSRKAFEHYFQAETQKREQEALIRRIEFSKN